ncbi:hypothetical protein BKA57DRAFT_506093 [Linnemannia elongata]|nr:hypothetical protein BKA57DRAFT_506093 [Linnemannia elongata]
MNPHRTDSGTFSEVMSIIASLSTATAHVDVLRNSAIQVPQRVDINLGIQHLAPMDDDDYDHNDLERSEDIATSILQDCLKLKHLNRFDSEADEEEGVDDVYILKSHGREYAGEQEAPYEAEMFFSDPMPRWTIGLERLYRQVRCLPDLRLLDLRVAVERNIPDSYDDEITAYKDKTFVGMLTLEAPVSGRVAGRTRESGGGL